MNGLSFFTHGSGNIKVWSDFSSISIGQGTRICGIDFWELFTLEGKVSLEGFLDDRPFKFQLILLLIRWLRCRRREVPYTGAFGIDSLHISRSNGNLLGCRLENWMVPRP